MQRAVIRGRAAKGAKLPTHLGVDEKAIAKGHRYMTLVCDLQAATVQYIGEDRKEESLTTYFAAFDQEQRGEIEAISLDTWPAYINACTAQVPEAEDKMVFDRFHTPWRCAPRDSARSFIAHRPAHTPGSMSI